MSSFNIDEIYETLTNIVKDQSIVEDIINDLNEKSMLKKKDKPTKKNKKEWFIINDVSTGEHFIAQVGDDEMGEQVFTSSFKSVLNDLSSEYNSSKKGSKDPIFNTGDALSKIKSSFFKERGFFIKCKSTVEVLEV